MNREKLIAHICKEIDNFVIECRRQVGEPMGIFYQRKIQRREFICGQIEMMFLCDLIGYTEWSDLTYWLIEDSSEKLLKWTHKTLLELRGDK